MRAPKDSVLPVKAIIRKLHNHLCFQEFLVFPRTAKHYTSIVERGNLSVRKCLMHRRMQIYGKHNLSIFFYRNSNKWVLIKYSRLSELPIVVKVSFSIEKKVRTYSRVCVQLFPVVVVFVLSWTLSEEHLNYSKKLHSHLWWIFLTLSSIWSLYWRGPRRITLVSWPAVGTSFSRQY